MIKIALIEKNRCSFDELEKYVSPLLYAFHSEDYRHGLKKELDDYLWSVIEPYVRFIELNEGDDLLTVLCQNIVKVKGFEERMADEFAYYTEGSFSFPKRYMELFHCLPQWETYQKEQLENINNIGCLMSLKHTLVENNVIALSYKYDLDAPKFVAIDSVTKEDIIRIIKRRYFFSAVLIKENQMIKYYYQDPKYLLMRVYGIKDSDNVQKLSVTHLKYNLLFYHQNDEETSYINKIATRINGSKRLYGDVLMIHEMEEGMNIYGNLSIHEAKRLNVLSYGRMYDRQLTEKETHVESTIDIDEKGEHYEKKITPHWSRYIVSLNRMIKWNENKNKCINCLRKFKNSVICDKCFRLKYCSLQCQKEFWHYHQDECIN